jgi:hypothetical protein
MHHLPPEIKQTAIIHPGGTGGFTRATGEAAIQMGPDTGGGLCAFQQVFDEVNAAARSVALISEQKIGRAGGITKPTMHTAT